MKSYISMWLCQKLPFILELHKTSFNVTKGKIVSRIFCYIYIYDYAHSLRKGFLIQTTILVRPSDGTCGRSWVRIPLYWREGKMPTFCIKNAHFLYLKQKSCKYRVFVHLKIRIHYSRLDHKSKIYIHFVIWERLSTAHFR